MWQKTASTVFHFGKSQNLLRLCCLEFRDEANDTTLDTLRCRKPVPRGGVQKTKLRYLNRLDETNTFLIACHQPKRREKKLQSFKVAKSRKCIEFRRNVAENCFHRVSLWEITKSFMSMLLRISRRSQRYHSRHSAM